MAARGAHRGASDRQAVGLDTGDQDARVAATDETALPITSAGSFSPLGPAGTGALQACEAPKFLDG